MNAGDMRLEEPQVLLHFEDLRQPREELVFPGKELGQLRHAAHADSGSVRCCRRCCRLYQRYHLLGGAFIVVVIVVAAPVVSPRICFSSSSFSYSSFVIVVILFVFLLFFGARGVFARVVIISRPHVVAAGSSRPAIIRLRCWEISRLGRVAAPTFPFIGLHCQDLASTHDARPSLQRIHPATTRRGLRRKKKPLYDLDRTQFNGQ